ncbi:hypothetical protein FH972_021311 [Carpinus fangiana]|uniref:TRIP4/RQT4 C2HC5-type zinc finger domain-containing protein n=1 Tax=Carpinus fangiana TaxID=176857 RepID=A0A5N6KR53_9ROSI|nr:hypothetical protein FH972_021311 [Carpinus fangiana]
MATRSLHDWALPQLAKILPLDEDSLRQIITYTDTLSKSAAADHLGNILGDSPKAFEFISSFNTRRPTPPSEAAPTSQPTSSRDVSESEVPRVQRTKKKREKAPLHKLPPRQVDSSGDLHGAYVKSDEQDYMSGKSRIPKEAPLSNTLSLQSQPDAMQLPSPARGMTSNSKQHRPKPPPSASGPLITDALSPKPSRSSSPAGSSSKASAKINMTGGTSMRGQSSTLNDLDSAIRTLEMQTNPSLTAHDDPEKRRCNCMAQRHALLAAAPNCLKCGKVICAKEGLGPCTFCGNALLTAEEIQAMVKILKEERGKEKQLAHNAGHKKAEVSKTPRAFASAQAIATPGKLDPTPFMSSTPGYAAPPDASASDAERLAAAKQHRDRLLKFQADNAKRTRIHDEAADFETPDAGLSAWASPSERALQLKKQQKVLREQEWNARPDYEKRQMVASIDIVGGKAVRKMQAVERPATPDSELEPAEDDGFVRPPEEKRGGKGGAFSRNPLLGGGLIRPVFDAGPNKGKAREKTNTWRRVQDDNDDNEAWILDGGVYGDIQDGRVLSAEERPCG